MSNDVTIKVDSTNEAATLERCANAIKTAAEAVEIASRIIFEIEKSRGALIGFLPPTVAPVKAPEAT